MKRCFDVVSVVICLILLGPLLLFLMCLLALIQGRPIFFVQKRIGKNEKEFSIYKFRTMRVPVGEIEPEDESSRITNIGRFLRSYSMDELPELWNVFKGDMSLVGPRPLLPEYLTLYNQRQKMRHLTRPGITGWAQINGRNQQSWSERLEYDVWYVENQSFILDLYIIVLTFFKVLKREAITPKDREIMKKFEGEE